MRNDQKNFKKFNKVPLALSLVFLAASSILFAFIYGEISKNKKDGESAHAKWQTEADRRDEIRSLDRSIREIESERAALETHFADSSNVVPFLDTLEKLASSAGVKPEVTSVDIPDDMSGLFVTLQTRGSFEGTYAFIELLENSPYEAEIASFNIEREGMTTDTAGKTSVPEWGGSITVRLVSFTP